MASYNFAPAQNDVRVPLSQPGPRPGYTDTSPNSLQWNSLAPQWRSARSQGSNAVSTTSEPSTVPVRYPWSGTNRAPNRPLGWNSISTTNSHAKKPKRLRTAFTSQQMMELEQEFTRSRYLDRPRRLELAVQLNLNERTIKIWFQNRRMKEKKDRNESFDSDDVQSVESSPEVGSTSENLAMPDNYYQLPVPVIAATMNHQHMSQGYTEQWQHLPPLVPDYYENPVPQVNGHGEVPFGDPIYEVPTQYWPHPVMHQPLPQPIQQQPITQHLSPIESEHVPPIVEIKAPLVPECVSESVDSATDSTLHEEVNSANEDSASHNVGADKKPKNYDVSWIRSIYTENEFE